MKQLSKNSTQEELRAYFALVLGYAKTQDEFPVDLDDVWPIAYDRKDHAVRDLKKEKLFLENYDYITQKGNQTISPKIGENKTENEKDEKIETRGRKEEKYFLTPYCFEFFIARKVRPVFEVYRRCLHAMARRDADFLWAAIDPTFYTLTRETSATEIAEFIRDMRSEEERGEQFPIALLEVFAIAFPNLQSAIDSLAHYREGFDYIRKEKGGYYLSIEGFNWLIANKAQVVTNAYKIALERGWYPEKPRYMALDKEFKPAKMSRRLKSILGVKGTKSERVQSVQNHILSLQGDAESNEELSMLADLLQRTITYGNFIGQQPLDAE